MTVKNMIRKEPLTALFAGGLVGAGVALLMAPKTGREMRHRIGGFAEDASGKVLDYAEKGKAKVIDITEKGKKYVMGGKTLVKKVVAAGREAYVKEKERLEAK